MDQSVSPLQQGTADPLPLIRSGRLDLVTYEPERTYIPKSPDAIEAQRNMLISEFPAWEPNIQAAEAKGHSLDDIWRELSYREAREIFEQGRGQFEIDVEYGRTPETRAQTLRNQRLREEGIYFDALRSSMPTADIRELLYVAEVSGINPGVLHANKELFKAAQKHVGDIGTTLEYVAEWSKRLWRGWRSGKLSERAYEATQAREAAESAEVKPEAIYDYYGNFLAYETPGQAEARHQAIVERARREYQDLVRARGKLTEDTKGARNLRPPDSVIGAFLLSAADSAGFSIESGAKQGVARVLGGLLGGVTGGPGGLVVGQAAFGAVASIFNTDTEAKMEAGGILMDLWAKYEAEGMETDAAFDRAYSEVGQAMKEVYRNNLIWLGATNLIGDQLTFGMEPGKVVFREGIKTLLKTGGRAALPFIIDAIAEGVEEVGQEIITASALGEELDQNAIMEVFVMGSAQALLHAGVGRGIIRGATAMRDRYIGRGIDTSGIDQMIDTVQKVENGELSAEEAAPVVQKLAKDIARTSRASIFADTPQAEQARTLIQGLEERAVAGGMEPQEAHAMATVAGSFAFRLSEATGIPMERFMDLGVQTMAYGDWAAQNRQGGTSEVYGQSETTGGLPYNEQLYLDEQAWGKAVDSVLQGDMSQRGSMKVMTTPLALELAGAKVLPVYMDVGKIGRVMSEHGLTADLIKQVPGALADPVAIFKSNTQSDGLVVMTEMKDANGATIIAPFHLNVEQGRNRYVINKLASIYGKDKNKSPANRAMSGLQLPRGADQQDSTTSRIPNDQWFVNQMEQGSLLYVDTEKASSWLSQTGLQLPVESTIMRLENSIQTQADLVNMRDTYDGYYQGDRKAPNANIQFTPDSWRAMISFFETASASSSFHELAHHMMRVLADVRDMDRLDSDFAASIDTAFAEMGVTMDEFRNDANKRKTAQEKFAKTWEAYLATGKAPTKNLQTVFSRIRRWMLGVYSDVKAALGVEVSSEMAEFFDRLLATPEEIDAEYRENTTVGEVAERNRMLREAIRERTTEQTSVEPGSGGDVLNQDATLRDEIRDVDQKISDLSRTQADAPGAAFDVAEEMQRLEARKADLEMELAYERRDAQVAAQVEIDDINIRRAMREELSKSDVRALENDRRKRQVENLKALHKARIEGMKLRQEFRRKLKHIRSAMKDTNISWDYRQGVKELAGAYDLRRQSEKSTWDRDEGRFRVNDADRRIEMELLVAENPDLLDDFDPRDVRTFGTIPLYNMTIAEFDALYDQTMKLRKQGLEVEKARKEAQKVRVHRQFDELSAPLEAKRKDKRGAVAGREDLGKQYKGFFGVVEKGVDWVYSATLGSQRLLDWLDNGRGKFKGAFVRYFGDTINAARDIELRQVFRRRDGMEDYLKSRGLQMSEFSKEVVVEGVTRENGQNFTKDQVLSIYAGMKNRRSRESILNGNLAYYGDNAQTVANALIAKLTDAEKAAADQVIQDYEANFARINRAFVEAFNEGMEHEENYTPMRRLEFSSKEGLLDADTGTLIEAAQGNAGALGTLDTGFLNSRVDMNEKGQRAIDLGLFEIWLEQVDRQEHSAAFAGTLSDLRRVLKTQTGDGANLKALVTETHGRTAWKALVSYYNAVTRNSRASADDVLDGAAQFFGRSMSVAYLCGNLGTIIKQTTSYPRVLAHAGPIHMGAALAEFTANPKAFLEKVYELDPQLRDRQGNLMMRALRERSGVIGAADQALNIGMEPIAAVDRWVAAVAWKAVYDANITKGLSIRDAMREAQRTVLLTQQTTHVKDAPLIWQQSGYAKLAMIFTSEAAQMWGMTVYDMAQSIRRGEVPAILANALALTMTAAMFKLITDGTPDDDEDETWTGWFASALTRQSLEAMPLVGKEVLILWENTFGKPAYRGTQYSAFVAPLDKLQYGIKGVFDDDEDNNERAAWSLIEGMSLLGLPFPATGARRLWQSGRMASEGDGANAAFNLFGMRGWMRE